jgi:hypothetical protein
MPLKLGNGQADSLDSDSAPGGLGPTRGGKDTPAHQMAERPVHGMITARFGHGMPEFGANTGAGQASKGAAGALRPARNRDVAGSIPAADSRRSVPSWMRTRLLLFGPQPTAPL